MILKSPVGWILFALTAIAYVATVFPAPNIDAIIPIAMGASIMLTIVYFFILASMTEGALGLHGGFLRAWQWSGLPVFLIGTLFANTFSTHMWSFTFVMTLIFTIGTFLFLKALQYIFAGR